LLLWAKAPSREKEWGMRLHDAALEQLFLAARTHRAWLPREVPDTTLRELVSLAQLGPTANNGLPARFVWVKSKAAKERLLPHLSEGNRDKTMKAPATAIIGYDLEFYAHPPQGQGVLAGFTDKPDAVGVYCARNGSLQGAYLIVAARALGLDAGPPFDRISCAMWATAIRPRCARAAPASPSRRRRRSCRVARRSMIVAIDEDLGLR
jgi:3-hydroxypropanoate dehydrogenase